MDSLRQVVTFQIPGEYTLVASAAAPSGTLQIPDVGQFNLGDGEFTFTLNGNPIGVTHTIPAGSDWLTVSADFSIAAPGAYTLGVRNTRLGSYFINYDSFAVVPEPCLWILMLAVMGGCPGIGLAGRKAGQGGAGRGQGTVIPPSTRR